MLHSVLQSSSESFDISKALLYFCHKPEGSTVPEIDFDLVQRELKSLRLLQQQNCENVVEFVDQHKEDFLSLGLQLEDLDGELKVLQEQVRGLNISISSYRINYEKKQVDLQSAINQYEQYLFKNKLYTRCKVQSAWLLKFCKGFDELTNTSVDIFTFEQRHTVAKFCRSFKSLIGLFSHVWVPKNNLSGIVAGIAEDLEFYLSEQLACLSVNGKNSKHLDEIKEWFSLMGKHDLYFALLQQNLIGKQIKTIESVLVSNKLSLLSGKDATILQELFHNLFSLLSYFPETYPESLLHTQVQNFFRKSELKFLYTYAMPVFPVSYNAYLKAVNDACPQRLRSQFLQKHGWDLKRWAQVRENNIYERSGKDHDLHKWLDIIFKPGYMIEGTKSITVRTALRVITRFCNAFQTFQLNANNLNRCVEYSQKVPLFMRTVIQQHYNQLNPNLPERTELTINNQINAAFCQFLRKHISHAVSASNSTLEAPKSFVMRVISSKEVGKVINSMEIVLRPISALFRNLEGITQATQQRALEVGLELVKEFYCSTYTEEIKNYCQKNVTPEQTILVLNTLESERPKIKSSTK